MSAEEKVRILLQTSAACRRRGALADALLATRAARQILCDTEVDLGSHDDVLAEQAEAEQDQTVRYDILSELVARVESRFPMMVDRAEGLLTSAIWMQRHERHEATIALSRRSADIAKTLHSCDELALGRLAISLVARGRFREAVDAGRQHLAAARVGGSKGSELVALNNLADAYEGTHELQEALHCVDQMISIFERSNPLHGALARARHRREELQRRKDG